MAWRAVLLMDRIAPPKMVRRCGSVPQSVGGATPGGGGTNPENSRNISPTYPAGVQLASAIRPPGLQTRASSDAALAWSGANIDPKIEVTASNEPSGKGRFSVSPSTNSTL